jgi:hypothetical protein
MKRRLDFPQWPKATGDSTSVCQFEKGCFRVLVHRDVADPRRCWRLNNWTDLDADDVSQIQRHFLFQHFLKDLNNNGTNNGKSSREAKVAYIMQKPAQNQSVCEPLNASQCR